ncbi:thiamine-monophosphate kinase [Brevundimonas sp. Leaf363]|uniref:thiamine-phosphate kinase n=1 Tax=Brevundimonas sp. Leaf363 TaxID=1736353 RepID=UPI000700367D|nr:thiamine-phosphate kinase [Brevundimonas sp. Leaf363]KQS56221.1 thiamine-monophosphate kinase [Brevundimonas sp. Leaf363]
MAEPAGEFETIDSLLKPLAHAEWARGLADDVAVITPRPGFELVVTKDTIVEGVHFLPDDPWDTVAQKLLRVNLSDLAAKGAEPFGYLMSCAWSGRCGWVERQAFAQGLAVDQAAFGVRLLGGDTVATPGPATFSATLMGWAKGRVPARSGAQAGDAVFVTGHIGDGWLGLQAARGLLDLEADRIATLVEHYRRPMPRLDFASVVAQFASASLDVSDGLIADVGHIAAASGKGVELNLDVLPLSGAGQAWFDTRVDDAAALIALATGGDDYEIAFTAAPKHEDALRREAERRHLRLTRIGEVRTGAGLTITHAGRALTPLKGGWTHD